MNTFNSAFLPLFLILLLIACDKPASSTKTHVNHDFIATDITGLSFARDFALPDHHGNMRRLSDFKDKVVVMFFGFTQCPDICPTTLMTLSRVMQHLGDAANQVQVLFVTVDPERDTPQVLAQYLPAFDARFLGLVGNAHQLETVAKEFRIFYQKVPGKTPGSYTIDHTAGNYIFDPRGHVRLFTGARDNASALAQDIKQLLTGK